MPVDLIMEFSDGVGIQMHDFNGIDLSRGLIISLGIPSISKSIRIAPSNNVSYGGVPG